MPLNKYDRYFGGSSGSAHRAAKALRQEYGQEKGKAVFYAIVNKRKRGER